MPEGDSYPAVLGHWLPKLLGSDDTVLAGKAYFRMRFNAAGQLVSPSPGHLGHAGVHVRQYRALRQRWGWITPVVWVFAWFANELFGGGTMEAEADAYAEANRYGPVLTQQFLALRAVISKAVPGAK
jgi:hypothetical protein